MNYNTVKRYVTLSSKKFRYTQLQRQTTSSGACLSLETAYLRTAGCVKLELNNSKASSTSIGDHC